MNFSAKEQILSRKASILRRTLLKKIVETTARVWPPYPYFPFYQHSRLQPNKHSIISAEASRNSSFFISMKYYATRSAASSSSNVTFIDLLFTRAFSGFSAGGDYAGEIRVLLTKRNKYFGVVSWLVQGWYEPATQIRRALAFAPGMKTNRARTSPGLKIRRGSRRRRNLNLNMFMFWYGPMFVSCQAPIEINKVSGAYVVYLRFLLF